jgi:hypothetical protein
MPNPPNSFRRPEALPSKFPGMITTQSSETKRVLGNPISAIPGIGADHSFPGEWRSSSAKAMLR